MDVDGTPNPSSAPLKKGWLLTQVSYCFFFCLVGWLFRSTIVSFLGLGLPVIGGIASAHPSIVLWGDWSCPSGEETASEGGT